MRPIFLTGEQSAGLAALWAKGAINEATARAFDELDLPGTNNSRALHRLTTHGLVGVILASKRVKKNRYWLTAWGIERAMVEQAVAA